MPEPIKVVHLVAGELNGGAARGAYWLHSALQRIGVQSTILCNAREVPGDSSIVSVGSSLSDRMKFSFAKRTGNMWVKLYPRRQDRMFNTGFGGRNVMSRPEIIGADVVHLHWINGLVRIRDLKRIEQPVIWTIRDMWPFTGGCHYSLDCDRYSTGCGKCPQLGSQRRNDLSRLVVRHKSNKLPAHLHVVGISHWLSECARQSEIFRGATVSTISNNIDVASFFPVDQARSREFLDLDRRERIILIGAKDVTHFYKGFGHFRKALDEVDKTNLRLLLFGNSGPQVSELLKVPVTDLGFVDDPEVLRSAYSAADVFVAPSLMDAFGKTLAEAMACGTPVVCFDSTGPKDIVAHRITGYCAEPYEAADLARGIQWILNLSQSDYEELSRNAVDRVTRLFDSLKIADQYLELYQHELRKTAAPV